MSKNIFLFFDTGNKKTGYIFLILLIHPVGGIKILFSNFLIIAVYFSRHEKSLDAVGIPDTDLYVVFFAESGIGTARDGGKVVSLRHGPPLSPGNTPGTHFF
jgi:hypothetical protein